MTSDLPTPEEVTARLTEAARLSAARGFPPPPAPIGDDPVMRLLLPVGRSGWAIAAGYLGLFSLLALPGPLAVICGLLAIREIRRNPKKHGMGRAIFGLVMGLFGTICLVLILVASAR